MKNNNKFNKTLNPSGAEPPLGWWKFRKNRYITTNHPSITTKEKCAFKVETILSPQEKQILEGITRTLQTSKRDAVRIAIYELGKEVVKAVNFLKYANKETKERGHISRSFECSCRVIKTEKESAKEIAKTFEISEKEAVRLCIIWLGRKLNEINFRLTKCKRIGQEQLAREWSKEYDGSGSKLEKLKDASHAAYEDAAERAQKEVKERQDAAYRMKWMAKAGDFSLTRDFDSDLNRFMLTENMEEEERMEKEFEQILEDENIKSKREKEIQRAMFFFDFFTREDAERYAYEKIEEDKRNEDWDNFMENATDEEMIDQSWYLYFGVRKFNIPPFLDPIWLGEDGAEKRKKIESADDYFNRAYPSDYLEEGWDKYNNAKKEREAKMEEEKKQKKLRKKRDLVNDITNNIQWTKKRLEELKTRDTKEFSERRLESHLDKIRDIEDRQMPYLKRMMTDKNYLDLYWDELSQ